MVSNVLSLAFSFLGGVFVPMEIFGDTMLKIAKFMVKLQETLILLKRFFQG